MSDEELAAIVERARNATRGPWMADKSVEAWEDERRRFGAFVRFYQPNGVLQSVAFVEERRAGDPSGSVRAMADAAFIAYARDDVPALIAEVARLRAALRRCMRSAGTVAGE